MSLSCILSNDMHFMLLSNYKTNFLVGEETSSKLCNDFYLIIGHGCTRGTDRIIVHPNFNIITFAQVNEAIDGGYNDSLFFELFSSLDYSKIAKDKDYTNLDNYTHSQFEKLLSSPFFGNHSYLNLYVKLHPPGCEITNISFNFKSFNRTSETSNSFLIQKSGIYKKGFTQIITVVKFSQLYNDVIVINKDFHLSIFIIFLGNAFYFTNFNIHRLINNPDIINFSVQDLFKLYPERGYGSTSVLIQTEEKKNKLMIVWIF